MLERDIELEQELRKEREKYEQELKKEHEKGKYAIIVAVITAFATIIAAVIGPYVSKLKVEEGDSSELQAEIRLLQSQISSLESERTDLKTQIDELIRKNTLLEQELENIRDNGNNSNASSNLSFHEDAVVFANHEYKLFDESKTWSEAKGYCEGLGGHLVTITSQSEQSFIENLMKGGNKYQYWLGGTDESNEGTWCWVTGEKWGPFTNWDCGMPDNGQKREHYLQIYNRPNPHITGSVRGKWNDITIDNTYNKEPDFFLLGYIGFICEWDS